MKEAAALQGSTATTYFAILGDLARACTRKLALHFV